MVVVQTSDKDFLWLLHLSLAMKLYLLIWERKLYIFLYICLFFSISVRGLSNILPRFSIFHDCAPHWSCEKVGHYRVAYIWLLTDPNDSIIHIVGIFMYNTGLNKRWIQKLPCSPLFAERWIPENKWEFLAHRNLCLFHDRWVRTSHRDLWTCSYTKYISLVFDTPRCNWTSLMSEKKWKHGRQKRDLQ